MGLGKINRGVLSVIAATAMFAAAPHAAQGGFIALGTSGWTAEWDPGLDPFVQVTVDAQTSNAVFIEKFVQFTQPFGPQGQPPSVNITFRQTQPNALPFIVIEDEVITNQTGSTWFDFHMQVIDSGDAFFRPDLTAASGGGGPIGFSITPFTNAVFSDNNTVLDIFGGPGIPNNTTWFPGDGPTDGQLWIQANGRPSAPFTVFTLKEFPTIPEPTSLALLSIGGLFLMRRR